MSRKNATGEAKKRMAMGIAVSFAAHRELATPV